MKAVVRLGAKAVSAGLAERLPQHLADEVGRAAAALATSGAAVGRSRGQR